jgi:hypothetical protein
VKVGTGTALGKKYQWSCVERSKYDTFVRRKVLLDNAYEEESDEFKAIVPDP